MANRPYPRYASRDPNDGPLTTCDRCGFIWNLSNMGFQYDFFGGPAPQNTGFLVCPRCTDDYAWQYKLLVLPPDPVPFANTRPEIYAVDATSSLVTEAGQVINTESGTPIITAIPNPNDPGNTTHLDTNLSPPQPPGATGT